MMGGKTLGVGAAFAVKPKKKKKKSGNTVPNTGLQPGWEVRR